MDIFYVYPYLLLLEQGDCDAKKLNEASNDFIRHICRLHEGHGDRLRVFFHLQYMKFRLTHVVGAIMYVENTMERLGTPQEDTGGKTGCPPGEGPPVLWTADAINLVELLYACHELKLFNNGEISLKDLTAHVCQTFGVDVKNVSSYYARMRRSPAAEDGHGRREAIPAEQVAYACLFSSSRCFRFGSLPIRSSSSATICRASSLMRL